MLMCALWENEYEKVQSYQHAKDMWDMLITIYEESSKVKQDIILSTSKYLSPYEDEEEKVKFCIVTDSTSDDSNEEVDFNDLHSVIEPYNELMSNSSNLSKAYQSLRKQLKKSSKENEILKKDLILS